MGKKPVRKLYKKRELVEWAEEGSSEKESKELS